MVNTVSDILLTSQRRTPCGLAVTHGGMSLTYDDLFKLAQSVGSRLKSQGLKKGDCFLTLLQNHVGAVALHWAAQLYGFVICPINWRTTASELDYFVEDCGCKFIFFDESSRNTVTECARASDLIICEVPVGEFGPQYDEWWAYIDQPVVERQEVFSTDISVLLYTSGTTGRGKGVLRTHAAEHAAAMAHVAQNALPFGDVGLGVMPMYHTMGVRILLASALVSGVFVCQAKFTPEESLELIEERGINSLYLVPTLYHDLLMKLDTQPRRLASINRLGFAGASMTEGLLKTLAEAFPDIRIVNHYGSSEIYTYCINQNAAGKPGSAGKAGLNAQVAVVSLGEEDAAMRAPAGTEGQIVARADSPEAFSGYLNRPDVTKKAFVDGWYLTGDVGYFDDEGDIFVTGRVDDMIITGGENVMPAEIESAISLHKLVEEVVVVGKSDKRLGQCVNAHIVAKHPISHDDLDKHCRDAGLPGFKCPKEYFFVEQIPKSPVGKVLRRLL